MIRIIVPILLALAGCSSAEEEGAPPSAPETSAQPPARAEVPPLAGEWDVVAIDGGPVRQAYKMDASAGADRFTIRSECVRIPFSYAQDGNGVTFQPAPREGCGRVRTLDEDKVAKVVERASMAIFDPDGQKVDLSGSGGSISMARR